MYMKQAGKPRALAGLLLSAALLGGLAGCASTSVSRIDSGEEIALTDRWNDKDSELVAKTMIDDMLTFPWIQRYRVEHPDRRPTVIIQSVRNKSHEHISAETFINDLKRAMIRSGQVDFVVGGAERQDIREERKDQELNAAAGTQAAMGQESGANFALSGTINSFVDQLDGKRVTAYQVDLKLIDMTTNREVWNGQKKIKKLQEKSRFSL